MNTLKIADVKAGKTAISIAVVLTAVLACIFMITRVNKNKAETVKPLVVMQRVTGAVSNQNNSGSSAETVLQDRLQHLQQLQQQYNSAAAAGTDNAELQSLRSSVGQAEEMMRASIDSLWVAAITDKNTDSSHIKSIAAYRSSFDSIRSINNKLSTANNDDFVPSAKAFQDLQNELMDKTNKIALLESTIQIMSRQSPSTQNNNADAAKNTGAESSGNTELENRLTELTATNQRLLQDMERLKKQLADANTASNSEQLLLTRNTALQQKLTAVSAELQLVKVDCNLSRADATQIISNSKQRKALLSEASSILTELSANSDADVRNKVKEKIIRLNQVAANTRD